MRRARWHEESGTNLIDESARECWLIRAERRWSSAKVIGALADVMVQKGLAKHI
jgi:putative transposase